MSERYIGWVEPFSPSNEPVLCFVTEAVAIETQKHIGEQLGKPYTSDVDALQDFMVVHWADFYEKPIVKNQRAAGS